MATASALNSGVNIRRGRLRAAMRSCFGAPRHAIGSETSAQHALEGDERVLAVSTSRRRPSLLPAAAAIFAVLAAVVDVAELAHQLEENRTGIDVIAARLLVLDAGAGLAAALALNAWTRARARSPSGRWVTSARWRLLKRASSVVLSGDDLLWARSQS